VLDRPSPTIYASYNRSKCLQRVCNRLEDRFLAPMPHDLNASWPLRGSLRTHDRYILALHLILHGYGHWLPNDPRGSGRVIKPFPSVLCIRRHCDDAEIM